jgi:hypothetical protein
LSAVARKYADLALIAVAVLLQSKAEALFQRIAKLTVIGLHVTAEAAAAVD